MLADQLSHGTDEPGGGLVARTGDHRGVGENLVTVESAPRAVGSSTSALSNSVIRSSDGCVDRHSMYSTNSPTDSAKAVGAEVDDSLRRR